MTTAGSAVFWPATLPGSTSDAALAKKDTMLTSQTRNKTKKHKTEGSAEAKLWNSQVGAPVCRCEEPPPGPTSRRCPSKSGRLGVRGRRITGHPTSIDRCDVRPTARPLDQRRSNFILFFLVVGDPHEPATLWGLAGLRRQRLHSGWLYGYRPLPRYPVLSGRRGAILFLLTAGVLRTPSSIPLRRVHPCGILHPRCQ